GLLTIIGLLYVVTNIMRNKQKPDDADEDSNDNNKSDSLTIPQITDTPSTMNGFVNHSNSHATIPNGSIPNGLPPSAKSTAKLNGSKISNGYVNKSLVHSNHVSNDEDEPLNIVSTSGNVKPLPPRGATARDMNPIANITETMNPNVDSREYETLNMIRGIHEMNPGTRESINIINNPLENNTQYNIELNMLSCMNKNNINNRNHPLQPTSRHNIVNRNKIDLVDNIEFELGNNLPIEDIGNASLRMKHKLSNNNNNNKIINNNTKYGSQNNNNWRVSFEMSGILGELPPLIVDENQSESWKKWLQRFKLYLKAADVDIKKDDKKIAKLLHLIGEYGLEVFNTFGLDENDENLKYEDVVKKFTEYFSPRKNITMMRYQFFTRYQQKNEPMESFISDLKIKSLNCELKELRDDLVRDMIIIGMNDVQLKEKLLSRDNLKLEDVVTECRTAAITKKHVKEMQEKSCQNSNILLCTKQEDKTIDRIRCSDCHGRRHEERKCFKCGGPYEFGHKCLVKNIKCFRCNEFGHIARNCESTVRVVNVLSDVEENERFDGDCKPFFVDEIQNGDAVHESWYQDFVIQDERIRMKLDTGADANVFPIELYHELKFNKKLIVQKNVSLSTINSKSIPVKGVCTLKCWVNGKWYFIEFVLADIKCNPLIGLSTCERLGLIKRQKKREPDESDLCIAVINQKIQKKSPEPSAFSPAKSPDHLKISVDNVEREDKVYSQSYPGEVRDAVTRRPFIRTRIFVNSNRRVVS
ncbi:hypothetical protein WDU94_000044, partial [Cyamophila willieti]